MAWHRVKISLPLVVMLGVLQTSCSQDVEFSSSTRTVNAQNNAAAAAVSNTLKSESSKSEEKSCSLRISPEKPKPNSTVYLSATPAGFTAEKGSASINAAAPISMSCASNLCLTSFTTSGEKQTIEVNLSGSQATNLSCRLEISALAVSQAGPTNGIGADTSIDQPNEADTLASQPSPTQPSTEPSTVQANEVDTAAPQPAAEVERRFSFQIGQNSTSSPPPEIELVFIIDDSVSMSNKIKRLSSSLSNFASQLTGHSSVKTNLSYVSLSEFVATGIGQINQTVDGRDSKDPSKLPRIASDPFFYKRYASSGRGYAYKKGKDLYTLNQTISGFFTLPFSDHVFPGIDTNNVQAVVNSLNQLKSSISLSQEPGIAAMMSYLNFRKHSPFSSANIKPGSTVHYIMLSDEDNTRIRSLSYPPIADDTDIELYATNHAYVRFDYASTKSATIDICAAKNLGSDIQPRSFYQPASQGFCVYRNSGFSPEQAKSMINAVPAYETSYITASNQITTQYTAKLSDGSPTWQTIRGTTLGKAQYCSYYEYYNCTSMVDGVSLVSVVSSPTRAQYSSCSPVINSLKRDLMADPSVYNPNLYWNTPIECVTPTAKAFAYYPNLIAQTNDQGNTYTNISTAACKLDEDYIITNKTIYAAFVPPRPSTDPSLGSGIANLFCPKQVANTVLGNGVSLAYGGFPPEQTVKTTSTNWYASIGGTDVLTLDDIKTAANNMVQSHKLSDLTVTLTNFQLLNTPKASQYYRDNPASAADFFKAIHAENKVYVHSIVKTKTATCAQDGADAETSRIAHEYLQLSQLTNGLSFDICSANFDPLVSQIFDFVKKSTTWNYDLKSIVDTSTASMLDYLSLVKVLNKTTGRTLSSDQYEINNDQIILQQGSAAVGDQIEITVHVGSTLVERSNRFSNQSEASTAASTMPPNSGNPSNGNTNDTTTFLPSCADSSSKWLVELSAAAAQQEASVSKICSCSGFTNGQAVGPDSSGTGYTFLNRFVPCTTATQLGLLGENDDDVPVLLTLYQRPSGSYGPFTGKTMNGITSLSGQANTSYKYLYRVSKP